MYSRNRYGGGNWYQAAFWLIVGILIGQFIRFDVVLQPSSDAPTAQTTAQFFEGTTHD